MKLFNYVFLVWYQIYKKHDDDPDLYAAGMVSLYQLLTVINITSVLSLILVFEKPNKLFIIPIAILLFILNYNIYMKEDRYLTFVKSQVDSNKSNRFGKALTIGYLIFNFLLPWFL